MQQPLDSPRIVSINTSGGGVPKRPVERARVTRGGVEGDRQRDRRFHGGPDRAVSLYSAERIEALRAEGHPIAAGTTGENVTVAGVDWQAVVPGARLRLGDVLVEVTAYATPCKNIRGSFAGEEFTRISQKKHAGWSRVYARVVEEGEMRVGAPVEVIPARG
ncbi:MAG TPA: MOSC domain-containing protein [Gemmatimonadaceae bacterium]|nr:MOSC domain-containing protein [Gemmatimonadaceae bacterium]